MPSFVNALCQRRQQRPGRGRLSVGRQSTAGAPAGRKPLKSRKARNRLLQCPSGAAATLVTLLVPPATVSRAPATSWAGCEWGVHGHRRRRVRGEWLVTITKSVALRTAEERLSAQALIARQVQAACARGRNLCVRGDAQYAIRRISVPGAHRGLCRRENTRAAEQEYRSSPRVTLRGPPGGDRPREVVGAEAAPRGGEPLRTPMCTPHYPYTLTAVWQCLCAFASTVCLCCVCLVPEMC